MLLIKINDYKYQVLKPEQKNTITLNYEGQTTLPVYFTEVEIDSKYVEVDQVEAEVKEHLQLNITNYTDYLISFDIYLDSDGNLSSTLFKMQATDQEIESAVRDESVKTTVTSDVLSKIKLSDEQMAENIELVKKVCSNKEDLEQLSTYSTYLKSGSLRRKLIKRYSNNTTLSDKLLLKYNTVICYAQDVEQLITNPDLKQAQIEMIVDYILVSMYKLLKIEEMYTEKAPVLPSQKERLVIFLSTARKLLFKLQDNPYYISNFLMFIANDLESIYKISKSQYFDDVVIEKCIEEITVNNQKLDQLIKESASVNASLLSGGN